MGVVYPGAHISAAEIAGRHPIMDATADRVEAMVRAGAAPHAKTFGYDQSIHTATVARGKDRLIYTTHPEALHIEFGHWWVTPEGERIRWIPGLFIFRNAARRMFGR